MNEALRYLRDIDIGHQRYRQVAHGKNPQHEDSQECHADGDGAMDEEFYHGIQVNL